MLVDLYEVERLVQNKALQFARCHANEDRFIFSVPMAGVGGKVIKQINRKVMVQEGETVRQAVNRTFKAANSLFNKTGKEQWGDLWPIIRDYDVIRCFPKKIGPVLTRNRGKPYFTFSAATNIDGDKRQRYVSSKQFIESEREEVYEEIMKQWMANYLPILKFMIVKGRIDADLCYKYFNEEEIHNAALSIANESCTYPVSKLHVYKGTKHNVTKSVQRSRVPACWQ